MPKPTKPTGAQLYKRWLDGESFYGISYGTPLTDSEVEAFIRAYLKRRDKRRKRDAR